MDALTHLTIARADPGDPLVVPLIRAHLAHSQATTPQSSIHAMDAAALQVPGIRFWSATQQGAVLGCCALKALPDGLAEVKSVHVSSAARNRGIAHALMTHLIKIARRDGLRALVLETGSSPDFAAARRLYERLGFAYCGPIPGYTPDPNSAFMRLGLDPAG